MNNEQEHKLEQRIRFVAKHYEEGRLDTDKAWQKFARQASGTPYGLFPSLLDGGCVGVVAAHWFWYLFYDRS